MSTAPGRFARHLAELAAPAYTGVDEALAQPSLATLPTLLSPELMPRLEELAQAARASCALRLECCVLRAAFCVPRFVCRVSCAG